MLGHKKALCSPADNPSSEDAANDLASTLERSLVLEQKKPYLSPDARPRERALPKTSPTSSKDLVVKKEEEEETSGGHASSRDNLSSEGAPRRSSAVMPGTLLKHEESSDDELLDLSTPDTKKRSKKVRVSLPGPGSSLRLEKAKHLDPSKFKSDLTTMFIKTTLQHSGLFTVTSEDCEALEDAADSLGLQAHYLKRSNPDAVASGREKDVNFVIIAKNQKAIDETVRVMELETEKAAPPGTKPTEFYYAQLGVALAAGATFMWAGLAFS
jgi:hypothetical protein